MKLLVLSDSHGLVQILEKILKKEHDADAIIHLGDGGTDMWEFNELNYPKAVYQCKGNCDALAYNFSQTEIFTLCSKKIFACHGHLYNVKFGLENIYFAAKEIGADLCLYGHTHIPNNEYYSSLHLFNPGAVKDRHYGVIEITDEKIIPELRKI